MAQRDPRYSLIKPMLDDGEIQTFADIFKYIKRSVVAADLGKKVGRFSELVSNVDDFKVKELRLMAMFCNLTLAEIFKLIEAEIQRSRTVNSDSEESR